jgi:small-conductance mechanosensitive channel
VSLGILKRLRAAGIDIPYPQRVVHLRRAPQADAGAGRAA